MKIVAKFLIAAICFLMVLIADLYHRQIEFYESRPVLIQVEGQWFELNDTLTSDESGRYYKASSMMDSTLLIGVVTEEGLKIFN